MLYLLLIIIAIGVLLASRPGQVLLGWIIGGALLVGGLYLGFWIVIITIGLLSDKDIRDNIFAVIGAVMLISYAMYGVYSVGKKYQRGEFGKEIIKKKAKDLWLENWKQHKAIIVFLILAFSFIVCMLIWSTYY